MNNKKGISLISLVITIIVIIILATIVIFNGFGATESAQFARFTQEYSSFGEEIQQRYLDSKVQSSLRGESKTDSEIYAEMADAEELQIADVLDGKVLSEDLDGTKCYKLPDDRRFYEGDGGTYITDKGEIFTLPGYRYNQNWEERRYVTSSKYYLGDGTVMSGENTGVDQEETPPTNVEVVGTIPNDSTAETWALLGRIAKSIAENSNIKNTSGECTVVAKDNDNNWKKYTLTVGQEFTVRYNNKDESVRILGFNHDDLADSNAYGTTATKAGISFEFVNVTEEREMNTNDTNAGSWEESEMRAYLNGENEGEGLYKMDNATKNVIKAVKKPSIKGNYDSANSSWSGEMGTTTDKLWLLSRTEVSNSTISGAPAPQKEGKQYAFYVGKEMADRIKKLNGTEQFWWNRSPNCDICTQFWAIYYNGFCNVIVHAHNLIGVSPGFCI